MTPAQLQTWIDRGPRAEDVDELRECVKRYPYSGPLRMMLAKASELAQDMERRDDLLRAGAHVSSRRALFAYLMGPALVAEARAVHDEVMALEEVPEEELVNMVWHDQNNAASTEPDAASTTEEDPAPKEDESHAEEDTTPATRDAMVAAIASVISQDVADWNDEGGDGTGERATEDSAQVNAPAPRTQDVPDTVPSALGGVVSMDVGREAQPTSMFGQWLQQRARETGFGAPDVAEKGAAALIDAFLAKGDVRIGPIRDSLESTESWAKQSLVEDPSLVTETMAKLYAQQGQIGRARKAYKLLALKYPEKSVYFAAQLKKLRNS